VNWTKFQPAPVIGVDEVGRGCLAGPVVAAAVVLAQPSRRKSFFDSKTINETRREELAERIVREHLWCVAFATVEEIDRLNILQASLLAMRRAVCGLKLEGGHVLVDGKFTIPQLSGFSQTPLIKGDSRAEPISAASIVAKVARDQFMKELALRIPGYGFEIHKGYGTPKHLAALAELGACGFHRRSFAGIGEALEREAGAVGGGRARARRLDKALS